jgi:hypothetical protein
LDTFTEVKLTGGKKNPMQGKVMKKSTGNTVMIFNNTNINAYESAVKRRLLAEGKDPESFVVGERTWGTRVPNMPIIEHFKDEETKYYLECQFLKAGKSEYFYDGAPIAKEDIEGFPAEQVGKEESQGGVEDKVVLRTFLADSITSIRIDGKEFN